MTIEIDYLANHPELVPTIAKWCCDEWPWYYQNGTYEVAYEYQARTATLASIPCALVALDAGVLVGTIAPDG
jgi:hypothetical protein